jgi:hypothetical protein
MKKFLALYFLFFFYMQAAYCQNLHIDSTRFITGTKGNTHIRYTIPTADKGMLFVGDVSHEPGGGIPSFLLDTTFQNVFIGKIDSDRHISWLKVYGGSDEDYAISACQTPDGGYAVLAGTLSNNGDIVGFKGALDMWLLRLNPMGTILWKKCYGSTESDNPVSIKNTHDGGFIILGASNGSDGDIPQHYGGFFTNDWVVVKTDTAGNINWSKTYGGTGNEQSNGSILSVGNSYYILSSTNSTDFDCTDTGWHSGVTTEYDDYVLNLDDTGKILWQKSYGGSFNEEANFGFFDVRDSSIVVAGTTYSNDYMVTGYHDMGDMWVIKIKIDGSLVWQKTLGSQQVEEGTCVCAAKNGGYLAYGLSLSTGFPDTNYNFIGLYDCWLFALDNSGDIVSDKIFGGTDYDRSASIFPCLNGYAATGTSSSIAFTEGTICKEFDRGGAFISYFEYWPLLVPSISTGISGGSIVIYPNPSSDLITVEFPESEKNEVIIYNSTGKIIYSKSVVNKSIEVKIESWSKGLYVIRMQGPNFAAVGKLIKN